MNEADRDGHRPELPEGWAWKPVEALADGGGVFTDGDWILSEDLKSGTDVRLIQLGDVGVGAFLDKSSKWISQQRFDEIGCTQLQAGDLLISRMAEPLARTCILPHLPHPAITAVDVSVLRIPAEAGVDRRWVMHALNSTVVRDQAEREASGTTRKRITRKKLGRVMVPIPPLDEQKRLVILIDNQLDRISSGAEEVRRGRVALQRFEASAIRSALGGRIAGLSDETRRSLVHAERAPLSNLATIQYGWTAKASLSPIGPRMLRITDIQHGRVHWASVPYCEIASERRDQYLLRPGDIVFARTGATTGKSYLVQEDVPEAVFASYLIRVRPDERLLPDFLYLYFQGADYWEYVRTESRGTGQPNVNGTILGKLMAPVPSVEAQLEAVRVARRRLEAVAHLEVDLVLATKKERILRQAVLRAAIQGVLSPRAEDLTHASTEVYA